MHAEIENIDVVAEQKSGFFIERTCPNCTSKQSNLAVQAKNPAENLTFEKLKTSWFGFFRESCFFSYYRCESCGLLYNKKFFSGAKLGELYSSMPDNTAGQNMKNLRKTQRGYFDFFKTANFPKGAYLEFGPDIGLFTEHVVLEQAFTNSYLIEPNKVVHPQLEAAMNGKPSTILTDLFDLSAIPDKSVAAAVMIHVLDHMIDPKEIIRQLHEKLVDGGVILIVTHDERSLLAKILKSAWPAYCLQHPHLFNVKTTASFLSSLGFGKIISRKSANYFSIPYLLQHLLWSLGLGRFQFKEVPWLVAPLRLGNIITMAKKC